MEGCVMKYAVSILVVLMFISGCSSSQISSQEIQSTISTGIELTQASIPTEDPTLIQKNDLVQTNTPRPTSIPKLTNTVAPTRVPTTNPYLFSSGTYLVNNDIQPGIYQGFAGYGFWDSCYWERLSGLSGDFDAIIANDNSVGNFYVEIKETDFAFTARCSLAKIDSVPVPEDFLTTLEPGMYIVGRDIKAGTYKGQAGDDFSDSCYWERLSGVSGGFENIIANDNAVGQFYIEVATSDFALSINCPVERVSN